MQRIMMAAAAAMLVTGAGAAEQHRQGADLEDRIAECMGRGVIVADRAQHKAGPGAIEEPPDGDGQREREIDEGILPEQDAANERKVA